ncbi:olfactory receptor 52D1-like [Phyllobates terribilis]|uniref:olfactory receptor 52D1-like n=1 Tax=Phyllobates terribilis TaxID=111132 RepID=UPI003CCB1486
MFHMDNTSFHIPSTFFLIGFPGLEDVRIWTSIIFCTLYILTILGNSSITYIICTEKSLHGPMYFFLAMLAVNDLALPSSTVPKMLEIFWRNDGRIDASACLVQMFFVHFLSVVESGILIAMAYDRYIAICSPLRYSSILTYTALKRIAASILIRAFIFVLPIPITVGWLRYCGKDVVLHLYCEHIAVVEIMCGDTQLTGLYGFVVALFLASLDLLLIVLSYVMILRVVYKMPSQDARQKTTETCGSHVCVIIIIYSSAFFSFVTYTFGKSDVTRTAHIFLANTYILFPAFCNPIIYGVRTKPIRERVRKIMCQSKKRPRNKEDRVQMGPRSKLLSGLVSSRWPLDGRFPNLLLSEIPNDDFATVQLRKRRAGDTGRKTQKNQKYKL